MKCPNCGYDLTPGAICCPQCKTPVSPGRAKSGRKNRNVIIAIVAGVVLLGVILSLATRKDIGHKSSASDRTSYNESRVTESLQQIVDERLIYEKNDVKVTFLGCDTEKTLPEISFQIENNSDYDIYIETDNLSINDYMISRGLLSKVAAGKKAIDSIVMFSSDLTDCGITSIDKIEFVLKIDDANTYTDSQIDDSEKIIITI